MSITTALQVMYQSFWEVLTERLALIDFLHIYTIASFISPILSLRIYILSDNPSNGVSYRDRRYIHSLNDTYGTDLPEVTYHSSVKCTYGRLLQYQSTAELFKKSRSENLSGLSQRSFSNSRCSDAGYAPSGVALVYVAST